MTLHRRHFLKMGALGAGTFPFLSSAFGRRTAPAGNRPLVISTWKEGIPANKAAWDILGKGGRALDAVEAGVRVTEASQNCCVGLGARPDRDGHVTLDASIMDEQGNCGSVAFLERIRHPISVARLVMEKTPHVMLVGEGAQQFAVSQGFPLEADKLSEYGEKEYREWLKTSQYKPVVNIENREFGPAAPAWLNSNERNHDTIGMVALDAAGNCSGSCTTSGMGFKMRGRLGDSPIIGAGLYVDNEVGAATATGVGEEVIKICGTHLVVELMRQGYAPEIACRMALERVIRRNKGKDLKDIQVGFIAINKAGEHGAYALQEGFNYAVCTAADKNELIDVKYLLK